MACLLCASVDDPTDEDVIPRVLRALDVRPGSTTISVGEETGDKHAFKTPKRFQITLEGSVDTPPVGKASIPR